MTKEINKFGQCGKVFLTEKYYNKCECGNLNKMELYVNYKEGPDKIFKEIYLSFCPCGNVFKTDLLT